MNIKIRNIDKNVVAKLDDLARKNHLSRNKFLIELLEKNSIVPQMEQLLKEYKQNQRYVVRQGGGHCRRRRGGRDAGGLPGKPAGGPLPLYGDVRGL